MGSVVSKLRPATKPVFPYVTLGDLRHLGNNDSMGQNAGCLGKAYDPFTVPFVRPHQRHARSARRHVGAGGRGQSGSWTAAGNCWNRSNQRRAGAGSDGEHAQPRRLHRGGPIELLASHGQPRRFRPRARSRTRSAMRTARRRFAQNCLLARRLVEAGVPLVTVYSFGNRDWDTHGDNFQALKNTLLPPTDRGVSALLEDLDSRGLLDETLVVWMGDMGRTPRINKARAAITGRSAIPS